MGPHDVRLARANPASLIAVLDRAVLGFQRYVASEENLHGRDTFHGVFAACSTFVREAPMTEESWRALAFLLNEIVGPGDDEGIENAACTCFLENLAEQGHPLHSLLRGEALACWSAWV